MEIFASHNFLWPRFLSLDFDRFKIWGILFARESAQRFLLLDNRLLALTNICSFRCTETIDLLFKRVESCPGVNSTILEYYDSCEAYWDESADAMQQRPLARKTSSGHALFPSYEGSGADDPEPRRASVT